MRTISILLAMLFAPSAMAVIVVDDTGTTSAPTFAPSSLWDNTFANSVHIGNGWYLTAEHTAPTSATVINTVWDTSVGGDGTTLIPSDLAVFQGVNLGTVDFTIGCSTPTVGTDVLFIADGLSRRAGMPANVTHWNSSWTEVAPGDPSSAESGYFTDGGAAKRWGTNTVSGNGYFLFGAAPSAGTPPSNLTLGIDTTFDETTSSMEAQVDSGDSGGAMFVQNSNGTWELAGIISGKRTFTDQPSGTAVFGNESVMSDLAHYRSGIESITGISACTTAVPEPSAALMLLVIGLPAGFVRWRRRCLQQLGE